MKQEQVKLSQIEVNKANPRSITTSKMEKLVQSILILPKMLDLRPIVVDQQMVVLGGNMRYRAMQAIAAFTPEELKERLHHIKEFRQKSSAEQEILVNYWQCWQEKPVVTIVKASSLTDEEQKAFIIKDNLSYGEWDKELLQESWEQEDLEDWGVFPSFDVPNEEALDKDPVNEEAEPYTNKILAPTYTPSDKCPSLEELVDLDKMTELKTRIQQSNIPDEVKEFLQIAATRHLVFNYAKIADYYAHSSKDVQQLMEDSALVIIDLDKAIEQGYVKLSEAAHEMVLQAEEMNDDED